MFATLLLAAAITLEQGETKVLSGEQLQIKEPIETAVFDGALMPVFERNGSTYLVIAADAAKTPGNYALHMSSGTVISKLFVRVKKANFRVVVENTPYKPLTLSPEERTRREAERRPMLSALKRGEAGRIWQDLFRYPTLISRVSGEFGVRRIYTNYSSQHRGVDIVPDLSGVVRTISESRVLYAENKELYLEGKTVILDHGQGIISVYLHLADVRVKIGDLLQKGKEIGVAGSTGNSTGRHLHLAIIVAGAHVDPLKFIDAFRNLK